MLCGVARNMIPYVEIAMERRFGTAEASMGVFELLART